MEKEKRNELAWNSGAYQAWINRFGSPKEAASKLMESPEKKLGVLLKYFGEDVKSKKIMNLLGSNGYKAVALSLLGAEATVVDFSEENQRYALELAEAAGVAIRYIHSDVLKLPREELSGDYDVVFMENGILHYFMDLKPLFEVAAKLLKKGGIFILQDFHPVSTKLITSRGTTANIRKHKVTGDYFDTTLEEKDVSFSKYLEGEDKSVESQRVYLRKWTLGEIITAIASQNLCVKLLEELPNLSSEVFDKGIPKTFVVVAEKL